MRIVRVQNRDREAVLGDRVEVADRWWPRLRGYLGRPAPAPGEGLLIAPSQGVHMYWMRYPLDVAMLGAEGKVVAIYPELQPGTRTRAHRSATYALELPPGTLASSGTRPGDVLEWEETARVALDADVARAAGSAA